MENILLKEIAKSIENITDKIEKAESQTSQSNHMFLKKLYTLISESNKKQEELVKSQIQYKQQLKPYLESFIKKIPVTTKQHLVINGVLKVHVYFYTLFVFILLTFSIYILYNLKDTTNYQKAWEELVNLNHNNQTSKVLNEILKRNSN